MVQKQTMKKTIEMVKLLAIIVIPGAIPMYIGYKLINFIKKKRKQNEIQTDTQNCS
jgi:uncharacterized membrane protein SpoIIM required for sporulation